MPTFVATHLIESCGTTDAYASLACVHPFAFITTCRRGVAFSFISITFVTELVYSKLLVIIDN